VKFETKNEKGEEIEMEIIEILGAFCYIGSDKKNKFSFLFSQEQRQIFASLINNEILSKV
jgi:hypothetical protein